MAGTLAEVLLGQPPRGDGGGALAAAANEREDVRLELSQADSDLLSETLNATLIKWICELNGLQECVVYRVITKEADLKLESETDVNVASLGFKPSLEYVREKYGEGWEEATPPETASLANPDKTSSFAEPTTPSTTSEKDAIDALIEQELAQWQPVMEPMVAPLRDLMQRAADQGWTAQQLLDALPQLLPQMDDSELMAALLRTSFAARVGAAAGIENG